MKGITSFFAFWLSASNTYHRLKDDEAKRPVTVRMGVVSIIQSVIACAFTILGLWGFITCLNYIGSEGATSFILPLFGVIISAAVAITAFLRGFVSALIYWIYQLSLNKRAVGFVALAVWILAIAGTVVTLILIL